MLTQPVRSQSQNNDKNQTPETQNAKITQQVVSTIIMLHVSYQSLKTKDERKVEKRSFFFKQKNNTYRWKSPSKWSPMPRNAWRPLHLRTSWIVSRDNEYPLFFHLAFIQSANASDEFPQSCASHSRRRRWMMGASGKSCEEAAPAPDAPPLLLFSPLDLLDDDFLLPKPIISERTDYLVFAC